MLGDWHQREVHSRLQVYWGQSTLFEHLRQGPCLLHSWHPYLHQEEGHLCAEEEVRGRLDPGQRGYMQKGRLLQG